MKTVGGGGDAHKVQQWAQPRLFSQFGGGFGGGWGQDEF